MAGLRNLLARAGFGQFAGTPLLPHAFDEPLVDAQSATMGDPGLRLASSRGRRTFRAGGLVYHHFQAPQGGPATDEALAALPLHMNRRRALGTFRGLPEALPLTPPDPEGR